MFLVIGRWNGPLQFFKKDNQNICALGTKIYYYYYLVQWAFYQKFMKSPLPK
jgi:hypothetical protein